jgi:hypothetical protein
VRARATTVMKSVRARATTVMKSVRAVKRSIRVDYDRESPGLLGLLRDHDGARSGLLGVLGDYKGLLGLSELL